MGRARVQVQRRSPTPEQRAAATQGVIPVQIAREAVHATTRQRRVTSGKWRRVRRGVYAVEGSAASWLQLVVATMELAGPEVAASHDTCGRLFACRQLANTELLHVTGGLNRHVRLDGVVGHRSSLLVKDDVTWRHGVRCTTPTRLVIDMSGSLGVAALGSLLDDLLRRRLMTIDDLRERVAGLRPAPGRSVARLRAVLALRIPGYDPGESPLETRIVAVLARYGFPPPAQQFEIAFGRHRYRLDFAYPESKVFLEGNGFGAHSIASDLDKDARRQNLMVADGWRPLVFTWRMTDAEIVASMDALYDRAAARWR
jgi:hypothetical protein